LTRIGLSNRLLKAVTRQQIKGFQQIAAYATQVYQLVVAVSGIPPD
jgi:hypothetical protein